MIFRESQNVTISECEAAFLSGNEDEICNCLIDAYFSGLDRDWLYQKAVQFIQEREAQIAWAAALVICYIAYEYSRADYEQVVNLFLENYPKIVLIDLWDLFQELQRAEIYDCSGFLIEQDEVKKIVASNVGSRMDVRMLFSIWRNCADNDLLISACILSINGTDKNAVVLAFALLYSAVEDATVGTIQVIYNKLKEHKKIIDGLDLDNNLEELLLNRIKSN